MIFISLFFCGFGLCVGFGVGYLMWGDTLKMSKLENFELRANNKHLKKRICDEYDYHNTYIKYDGYCGCCNSKEKF